MRASTAVKAGQVVEIDATGVSNTVNAALAESGARPIGVAAFDASENEDVTVYSVGSVVYVVNADDTTGIDAGHGVEDNDCAVGGTISAIPANTGAATVSYANLVGVAIDDIAGGGIGRVRLLCSITCIPNNA
ncbi:MAG TPA: hypothetical protein DD420_18505 [Streptomyces sp.]|nr:hypothetical protein [Streptomyces sp.]